MRLINTNTGEFETFWDTERPQYAILSHTWGADEVSYLDYLVLTSKLPATSTGLIHALLKSPHAAAGGDSAGMRKVQECRKLARRRGLDWVWVDTCCIDSSSSAELSEAINSMWSWYRDAAECYVYLQSTKKIGGLLRCFDDAAAAAALKIQFAKSRWFQRGWTLQELLAPRHEVLFCNARWEILASKAEIVHELSAITSIPLVFLDGSVSPADNRLCSIAMRMSWLARRQTTRVEDMAYCMLGLFDVHMPLIYGEGRKAFMRLQLEILKKSDDDSIYAWKSPTPMHKSGLLATWPTAFADSGNIVQLVFVDDPTPWIPPVMTSIGLEMRGRYERDDPHQDAVDARHGVHTIHTAINNDSEMCLFMFCGPLRNNQEDTADDELPITRQSKHLDREKVLSLVLRRQGATWQRVNCNALDFVDYTMCRPRKMEAYNIFYVDQQGL
ncbi:hypothetical protein DV735_g1980, partial [Chaetothyriales sp. CBS 134920]